jgi:cyclopropane-fatty-acyl-phospholipid synthase
VLEPGGRVGLQAILQDDHTVRATRDTYTWIRKYIFPGGQLASTEAIERVLARVTSLRIADRYAFGRHYAETLRRWRERFEASAAEVSALGFDETFRRMWSLYLAYCEAGFRTGYLDVAQFTITKPHR